MRMQGGLEGSGWCGAPAYHAGGFFGVEARQACPLCLLARIFAAGRQQGAQGRDIAFH
jgi:hypothetical protein